jgi:hypothetical protein
MQTRENIILSIKPILRKKILHMLEVHPSWASHEIINESYITEEIPRSRYERQNIPKHGQQNIPKHGQHDIPKHGQHIIQGHEKRYTTYCVRETIIKNTADFVENNLDHFVSLCCDCFKQLNKSDCESIGTQSPTPNARKLYQLLNYLVDNGFPGPNQFTTNINFWSGDMAVKKASEADNEISVSAIPAFAVLLDVCQAIKQIQWGHNDFIHLIESCIMRLFASHAKGITSVYISSDKASERASFISGNFFWTDELIVLQELKKRGYVVDIQIHLYDHQNNHWQAPVSLFSPASHHIPIRTRGIHPLDSPEITDRFKKPHMTEADKIAWRSSQARPEISFGRMREIVGTWRKKAELTVKLHDKCEELINIYKQDIASTETTIQGFKSDTYYAQTKAKLDTLELMKNTDSIHDAKIIFDKNKQIFAIERDKYKTRILRGIALICSFGLSYGLSDAKNLNNYFTHTRSSMALENIIEPAAAYLNKIKTA